MAGTTTIVRGAQRAPLGVLRWGVRHGLVGAYLDRAAGRGDLVGQLLRDPEQRRDPYPLYEELRARGALVSSTLGPVTTSHRVAAEVLRSTAFGVGCDRAGAPRWMQWALRFGDEDLATSGPAEPPSMLVVDPPDHTRFRRLVSRSFTPRATAAFEPVVQRTADRPARRPRPAARPVDLIAGYAAAAAGAGHRRAARGTDRPARGLPALGRRRGRHPRPRAAVPPVPRAERALRAMHAFLGAHFERLRRDPGDDLVSQLVGLPGDDALTERRSCTPP